MAIRFTDSVGQKIYDNKQFFDKNIRSLTKRQVRWVQSYLSKKDNISFQDLGSNSPHDELIRQLAKKDNFQELVHNAYTQMQYKLIPEREFEWLKNNTRAQIFTLEMLSKENNYYLSSISSNDFIDGIYNFFDEGKVTSLDAKIIILERIKKRWLAIKDNDKYSNWLKENDDEQISWVRNYLSEKGLLLEVAKNLTSIAEKRAANLASLDLIDIDNYRVVIDKGFVPRETANKELVIDKMKRAWSQQKYRNAGKTKKPYHLPLTKKTRARLEKMAKVQGLSETAMLDILINRLYELDYIDVDGKDLY